MIPTPSERTPRAAALVLAAVAVGAALRFSFAHDVEFKGDERWMWEQATALAAGGSWRWSGMESSVTLSNPGAALWAFAGLVRAFGLETPPALAMGVAACAVAALLLAALMAFRVVGPGAREAWLWGVALAAVSPLGVLLQRKIWAQSLLPLASVAMWWCWLRRDRAWGSAGWGALGVLMGQIHLSGFFLAAALAAWTRVRAGPPGPRWRWWWAGALLAALPLVPWALEAVPALAAAAQGAAAGGGAGALAGHPWWNALVPRFWALWVTEPTGLLGYSLGPHFADFLRGPRVGSVPSGLMGLATALSCAAVGRGIWTGRRLLPDAVRAGAAGTPALMGSALVGLGVLLTLSTLPVHRHYLLVVFPLPLVWIAGLSLHGNAARGRRWLAALVVAQAVLSVGFLGYVHERGGAPEGDYGAAWSAQQEARPPSGR